MKKISLLFLIILSHVIAQTTSQNDYFNDSQKLKLGMFLGGNGSSLYGSNTKGMIYKISFSGGVSTVKKISDNLHLRCELFYINKGYKTSRIEDDEYIDKKQRYYFITEYLEFPILLQFYMPIQKYNTNWMVGLAPAINLTTRRKIKIDDDVFKRNIDDKNRLFDINFVVGSNIMMTQNWNLDLRASAGLIPINVHADFLGNRNISILLSLGYFF